MPFIQRPVARQPGTAGEKDEGRPILDSSGGSVSKIVIVKLKKKGIFHPPTPKKRPPPKKKPDMLSFKIFNKT